MTRGVRLVAVELVEPHWVADAETVVVFVGVLDAVLAVGVRRSVAARAAGIAESFVVRAVRAGPVIMADTGTCVVLGMLNARKTVRVGGTETV